MLFPKEAQHLWLGVALLYVIILYVALFPGFPGRKHTKLKAFLFYKFMLEFNIDIYLISLIFIKRQKNKCTASICGESSLGILAYVYLGEWSWERPA